MQTGNKTIIIALLLFCTLSSAFQCNKKIGCGGTVYNFEMGIKAYPDKEVIRIGDTIWLELDEPTKLYEHQTGMMIDYSNAANLGTAISMAELISSNNINTGLNSFFNFILITGKEVPRLDSTMFREYSFVETSGRYKFKLGIIPLKIGAFKTFISNASNVYRKNDKCTKASFAINFIDTNQHLYLNEIVLPGISLPPGGGVYLFKVE